MKKDFASESIRIAEELAKDIYNQEEENKEISSLLKDWKMSHPDLYEELKQGTKLSEQFSFYDQADAETAYKEIEHRIFFRKRRNLMIRIGSIAASIILLLSIGTIVSYKKNKIPTRKLFNGPTLCQEKKKQQSPPATIKPSYWTLEHSS